MSDDEDPAKFYDGPTSSVNLASDGLGPSLNESSSLKKTKKRRKKDPKAPKRPLSGYNIFFSHQREELQANSASPGLGFTELVLTVSGRWRDADEETRAKYATLAKEDLARYTDEMAAYDAKTDGAGTSKSRRTKFNSRQKRPLSGYNIFFMEEHARVKADRQQDKLTAEVAAGMTATIAKKWGDLPAEEKKAHNKRASELHLETQRLQGIEAQANALARRSREQAQEALPTLGGVATRGMVAPPPELLVQYQQYCAQVQAESSVGASLGGKASQDPLAKQQHEQRFHQLYMQWHFDQMQKQHAGQWQDYQKKMNAAARSTKPSGARPKNERTSQAPVLARDAL